MLELKNIKKDYPAGDGTVHALKGVSLQFRESEFVSILGPSGCGKTTLLNIIGGLDQYTEGDLIINGRSTKNFKDRDWDAYRNHSVGFVFQSYNLIPHQTVLQNVELALSLSGVSKAERKSRAKKALEDVGLGSQLNKRPSEMSGGQMQRVAIARALVNNPDIILADEPTGALDSETSVQVMNILKEVAKDRLVVMVTHNPELAEQYSTRIIRVLDGNILSDSSPLSEDEASRERVKEKIKTEAVNKTKKPSMSMMTSFGLSLKNLFTKKGRTILTSFAGSIGIIGIALILAVSQGMTAYIDAVQEDTLSSYPLTLEAESVDIGKLMETFMGKANSASAHDQDAVYQKGMLYDLLNTVNDMDSEKNDLASFKEYLEQRMADEDDPSGLSDAVSGIQYTYDNQLTVYTKNVDGEIVLSDSRVLLRDFLIEYMGTDVSGMMDMGRSSTGLASMSPMGSSAVLWQEMLPGEDGRLVNDMLEKQYDVIYGSWPTEYNEVVLVVDKNNEIDDMTLYALGLIPKDEVDALADAAINQAEVNNPSHKWTFEEICDMEFRTVLNSDCYTLDESTGLYTDLRESQTGLKYLYDNGIPLKVSGIIRPNEDALSAMLNGTIGYTNKLTEYIIEESKDAPAILAQLDSPNVDIFNGLPFNENTGKLSEEEKAAAFRDYIAGLSSEEKAAAYTKIVGIPEKELLNSMVSDAMEGVTREDMEQNLLAAMVQQTGMAESEMNSYLTSMTDEDMTEIYTEIVTEQIKMQYAGQAAGLIAGMTPEQMTAALTAGMETYTEEQLANYYDEVLEFSDSTQEANLRNLGYVDLEKPSSINLYAVSFEAKDVIEDAIASYNDTVDELKEITYTDYVGLMMSSVTTIINAITYVLVAFVGISLVVSSIMIGVITLISVQERTKEIGILRAIGASKKNVSSMFNAETVIIGFTSGVLGVGITYLLCMPINALLRHLTGIGNLTAFLPFPAAIILVCISVLLTLISGIIPSRSAAKKDPVVALRSE